MTQRHQTYPGFPCKSSEAMRQSAGPASHPARTPVADRDKNSTSAMPSEPQNASADTLIEIDHVTFGYDASRTILNDLTLRFQRGKVTSILGSSGCGKTTLLRLIGGVHGANSGSVKFDGELVDVIRQPLAGRCGHDSPR